MITVLTLGIPGDAITAIIMGVFIVHGIVPGPSLFLERPEIVNGVFAALLVINVVILLLLVVGVKGLARLAYVDPRLLGLGILTLCFVGAYSAANSMYYVWVALAFGVFGLICARANIPTIPLILGHGDGRCVGGQFAANPERQFWFLRTLFQPSDQCRNGLVDRIDCALANASTPVSILDWIVG